MERYEKVPFNSGSKGLDKMVSTLQGIPANRVVAPSRNQGGMVNYDNALGYVLTLITRIGKLSPSSPGAAHIPMAVGIGWDVYQWVQLNASKSTSVIPGGGNSLG